MNPISLAMDNLSSLRALLDKAPWVRPALFWLAVAAYVFTKVTEKHWTQAHGIAEEIFHALIPLGLLSPGSPSPTAVTATADAAVKRAATPSPVPPEVK